MLCAVLPKYFFEMFNVLSSHWSHFENRMLNIGMRFKRMKHDRYTWPFMLFSWKCKTLEHFSRLHVLYYCVVAFFLLLPVAWAREKQCFLRDGNLLVWRNSGFSYLPLLVNKVLTIRCTHLNSPKKFETSKNIMNAWNSYNVQCATSSTFNIYIRIILLTILNVKSHCIYTNSTALHFASWIYILRITRNSKSLKHIFNFISTDFLSSTEMKIIVCSENNFRFVFILSNEIFNDEFYYYFWVPGIGN